MRATDTPGSERASEIPAETVQDFIKTAVSHPAVSASVKEYVFGAIRAGDDPQPEIAEALRLAIDDVLATATAADWENLGGDLIAWARGFLKESTSPPASSGAWVRGLQRPRKPPVKVDPDAILAWLRAQGSATLHEIAQHFDISTSNAQQKADGLVHRGKLDVTPGSARERTPRSYSVAPAALNEPSVRGTHHDRSATELQAPPPHRELPARAC